MMNCADKSNFGCRITAGRRAYLVLDVVKLMIDASQWLQAVLLS
jgi:hypothetical protein